MLEGDSFPMDDSLGVEVPLWGNNISHASCTPCLEKTSRPHMVVSLSTFLLMILVIWGVSPNASLYAWERHYGVSWMRWHHILWRIPSYADAIRGGKEIHSVLSLQLLEDKQHLGGEDCNVPKFS